MDMRICFISRCRLPSYNVPKDGNTFLGIEFPRCLGRKGHNLIIGSKSKLDDYDIRFLNLFEQVVLASYSNNRVKDSFTFYRALKKIMKRTRIDIVHLINTDYLVFPLLCKIFKETRKLKLIYTFSMPYFKRMAFRDYLLVHIKRIAFSKLFDGICVTSPLLYDLLIKQNIDKEKIFLIPPPIDSVFFDSEARYKTKSKLIKQNRDQVSIVLYFGDLHPLRFPARKVLNAISLIKKENINVKLIAVSRYGSEHLKINEMAQKMNLNGNVICYTKSLRNEEKVELYSNADVVIFPFEGFMGIDPPATLLEAMSCGKIVVASRIQSMPYIIKDGFNGILVDPLTPEKLAEQLKFTLTSEEAKKMGANARETILQHFSKEKVTQKLLRMYKEVSHSM